MDDKLRQRLADLVSRELEATRKLVERPPIADGETGTDDRVIDAKVLLQALVAASSWSWYRFAREHADVSGELRALLAEDHAGLGDLRAGLEQLREEMSMLQTRLEGGLLDARFNVSKSPVRKAMLEPIAAHIHRIVEGLAALRPPLAAPTVAA